MTPNSGYELVPIVMGYDYSTDNNPIYALLCTKSSGTAPITIQAPGNATPITINADTFKVGVVYYFYLKMLVDDASATVAFVGYRYPSRPMIF
jgi:hypothetical protein